MHLSSRIACLAFATAASALGSARAQDDSLPPHPTDGVIYEENFDGNWGYLNGRVVDEANNIAWEAGNQFWDHGLVDSGSSQAATLPFNPVAGVEYTAEATIDNPDSDWIAFGFRSGDEDWTQSGGSMRHNNGGYGWMLTNATTQEAFLGEGTTNLAFRVNVGEGEPVAFKIVLNTFEEAWRVEYFINGASYGIFPLPASAVDGISGIGFSRNAGSGSGGVLSDFRLSASTMQTLPPTLPRPPAETGIVYEHDFGGDGAPLNETSPDIGEASWAAGDSFLDDGTVEALESSGQAAWLPFEPGNGGIYTAEATVTNPGSGWIAFGFLRENPTGGIDWTETAITVRHSNGGGYAWILTRTTNEAPVQQIFDGPNTGGNVYTGDATNGDPNEPVQMKIVLNTTAADWTATYFINGNQIGEPSTLPPVVQDRLGSGIGGIGFSRTSGSEENGVISAFRLTGVAAADLPDDLRILATDIDPSSGTATFSWSSAAGSTYRIESSVNLVDWETVSEGIEAEGETAEFEATGLDLTGNRKFFRVTRED